ncbi:hypothetical protein JZ751_027294 [Albula glossodonta]|uniref:NHR domain-containing protein n=1 Tax=Albula glossodonta TaxID=121402 RepID=A0A8T2NNI9_9TELE|nr:hypothetical protein JZ751_027294 [Albula glossodonta]
MGGQITRNTLYDTLGSQFPATSHRCHHKPKRCLPVPHLGGGGIPASPLLFHPNAKGSQIIMDLSQRAVKRQASFCNAITFSNRPVAVYEQVRLKITKKQSCWSGALRLGFTTKDPSRINPDSLPKYACPDLVSQSGFWAKALPEEFANEGNVIAFWVDKKGRVFYRINDSSPMLFFSGVNTVDPLWALIDVYGLTRGVHLLGSEVVQPSCLRPRPFTTVRMSSLRRDTDESRLSVSLCDLNLNEEHLHLAPSTCPIPQNSLNSQRSHLLPTHLDSDLHFHLLRGTHIKALDEQTVARSESEREERTLVFTDRQLRSNETVFVKVTKSSPARLGSLSYGVTSCDPGVLRPSDLPHNPESLVDRKEFWAVCRVPTPLHSGDVLGFVVNSDGEVILSHNGRNAGMQVCVDNSRPLWMFFSLHGAITQLRILGLAYSSTSFSLLLSLCPRLICFFPLFASPAPGRVTMMSPSAPSLAVKETQTGARLTHSALLLRMLLFFLRRALMRFKGQQMTFNSACRPTEPFWSQHTFLHTQHPHRTVQRGWQLRPSPQWKLSWGSVQFS